MSTDIVRIRAAEPVLAEMLTEHPAIWITGPRACGKTTTAMRFARTIVRLDRPAEAEAFRADPDAALRKLAPPVLLDEWQEVPVVLGAVKRAVDADPTPGRFVITGSVRAAMEAELWPGTGRLVHLRMYPLTQAELEWRAGVAPLLDRLIEAVRGGDELAPPTVPADLRDIVERIVRGGFPQPALMSSERARMRWYDAYVEEMVHRDAPRVEHGRNPERVRRYFEAFALHTGCVVDDKTLYDAAGIARTTAVAYEELLHGLSIVHTQPAWFTNRLKRLIKAPKRHVVDPALVTAQLRFDADGVMRHGDVLGRLLETFVVMQLLPTLAASGHRPRLYHLRTEQGREEVDLLFELGGGRVVAFEVKASAAPTAEMARHLFWLRERLGESFVAGAVLHTGQRVFPLGDRILAVPMACLWSP